MHVHRAGRDREQPGLDREAPRRATTASASPARPGHARADLSSRLQPRPHERPARTLRARHARVSLEVPCSRSASSRAWTCGTGASSKACGSSGLRDAGDPVECAAPLRRRRARTRSRSSTSRPRTRGAARCSTSSPAPPTRSSCRSPSAAASATEDDVRALLAAGADKVSINTAAVQTPGARAALQRRLGRAGHRRRHRRQAPARRPSGWEVFVHGGRTATGLDAVAWAERGRGARRRRDPAHEHGPRRDARPATTWR